MLAKTISAIILILLFSCKDDKTTQDLIEQTKKAQENQMLTQNKLDSISRILGDIRQSNTHLPISELNNRFEKNKVSVLLILAGNEESITQGSAFLVGENGLALSNYHVFKDKNIVVARDFEKKKYEIEEILSYDEIKDYTFFRISNCNLPHLKIASTLPRIGDQCFAIGNPHGLEQTLSTGIISGYRGENNYIQTSAEITHGSSGGPLFNSIGEVIGITTSGVGEANLNFAVNLLEIPFPAHTKNEIHFQPTSKIQEFSFKALVFNYYTSLFNEDWNQLNNLYAPVLTNFLNFRNFSRHDAIEDHKNYYAKFVVQDYNIINSSYTETNLFNTMQTSVKFKLHIKRRNDGKDFHYVIQSKMEIDNEGKIVSIKEELLQ
jgi:serine protease Do